MKQNTPHNDAIMAVNCVLDMLVGAGSIGREKAFQVRAAWAGMEFGESAPQLLDAHASYCDAHGLAHPCEACAVEAQYEQVIADHNRLVRELDVLLNGEDGAAKQASLCDIVSQVRRGGITSAGTMSPQDHVAVTTAVRALLKVAGNVSHNQGLRHACAKLADRLRVMAGFKSAMIWTNGESRASDNCHKSCNVCWGENGEEWPCAIERRRKSFQFSR